MSHNLVPYEEQPILERGLEKLVLAGTFGRISGSIERIAQAATEGEMSSRVFIEQHDETESYPTIPLQPMAQQAELRVQSEDWTGVTDPAERRRLQNRLHQRLWRKRKGLKRAKGETRSQNTQGQFVEKFQDAEPDSVSALVRHNNVQPATRKPARSTFEYPSTDLVRLLPLTTCNLSTANTQTLVEQFNRWYLRMAGSPSADLLLPLVQFNVFRALMSNTYALGFTTEWLSDDAISPFNTMPPDSGTLAVSCPASLRPSLVQHTVEHHPWIDLFPFPTLRDNLLRADGTYDEDELCVDLVEFCQVQADSGGLVVWGEPSNPHCWEVSEHFARKWTWILKGCHELLASTNYWRSKRGDMNLAFEV